MGPALVAADERKTHRERRRGKRWYRAPRFNNRRRAAGRLPPSLESVNLNNVQEFAPAVKGDQAAPSQAIFSSGVRNARPRTTVSSRSTHGWRWATHPV